jgi:hypothetical protein
VKEMENAYLIAKPKEGYIANEHITLNEQIQESTRMKYENGLTLNLAIIFHLIHNYAYKASELHH